MEKVQVGGGILTAGQGVKLQRREGEGGGGGEIRQALDGGMRGMIT